MQSVIRIFRKIHNRIPLVLDGRAGMADPTGGVVCGMSGLFCQVRAPYSTLLGCVYSPLGNPTRQDFVDQVKSFSVRG
ncbi:MAG: hypothetical protein HN757_03750 [Calditrichaeota bacterium]|jgi:hypothetical protein|nr:hypothetical protein [Calditrichota bacterium]